MAIAAVAASWRTRRIAPQRASSLASPRRLSQSAIPRAPAGTRKGAIGAWSGLPARTGARAARHQGTIHVGARFASTLLAAKIIW